MEAGPFIVERVDAIHEEHVQPPADPRTVRLALELLERTSILAINALAQPLARLEIRRVPSRNVRTAAK